MKKIRNILMVFMLVISTIVGLSSVAAHPPQDMELEYDLQTSELNVTITHETPAPSAHYINKIEIEVNEVMVLTEEYEDQPSNALFSYVYLIAANIGDIITVKAYCNIQGVVSRSLNVQDPTQDDPPTVDIKNPVAGYFHFSGIRLFATYLNLISETMGFGGFRLRPVQVFVDDDVDASEDLDVKIYVDEELLGEAIYNPDTGYHELQWTGPRLGTFTLKATAEDSQENIAETEIEVWYFCFIP